MKKIVSVLPALIFVMLSCNEQNNNTQLLQNQIDSLEIKLSQTYKPGFGEFMGNVQAHHAKLWYAGQNKNWKLANFEMDEIKETFEDIAKYETDRDESQLISMIEPALDSVTASIQRQDPVQFKDNYTILTNTCNACHQLANFEFNVVKIPDKQTFSNQDFKAAQ